MNEEKAMGIQLDQRDYHSLVGLGRGVVCCCFRKLFINILSFEILGKKGCVNPRRWEFPLKSLTVNITVSYLFLGGETSFKKSAIGKRSFSLQPHGLKGITKSCSKNCK